jgi:hypothetical protein
LRLAQLEGSSIMQTVVPLTELAMRLVKLLAYSLLGYVLYELFLGLTEGAQPHASIVPRSSRAKRPVGRPAAH